MIRLIGGRWRGRKLVVLDEASLRPTPNRVRETLFNWLQFDLPGQRCLDLFAGSGALGFEALSRGAAFVDFCEKNSTLVTQLEKQAVLFKADPACYRIRGVDSLQWITQQPEGPYGVIFCDPPFHQEWAPRGVFQLCTAEWLTPEGVLYLETEKGAVFDVPPGWQVMKHQKAGEVEGRLIGRITA